MFGFHRIAVATPKITLADPIANVATLTQMAEQAERNGAQIVVFPELALTGATCGDLFTQPLLLEAVEEALAQLSAWANQHHIILVVGAPQRIDNRIENHACIFFNNEEEVDSVMIENMFSRAKSYIPADSWQARIFTPFADNPHDFIFNPRHSDLRFAVVFDDECFDPQNTLVKDFAHAGANVIFCLSSAPYIAGTQIKAWTRGEVISAQHRMVYAVANSGAGESSSDNVYGGNSFIAEDGTMLAVSELFSRTGSLIFADIDVEALNTQRLQDRSFATENSTFLDVELPELQPLQDIYAAIDAQPFVPDDEYELAQLSEDVLDMQANALIQRLDHMGAQHAVIGLSGGLDSTLTLLATHRAFENSGRDTKNIITVTMPGFGTGKRTYENACTLAKALNITLQKIDITNSCKQHFDDIDHAHDDTSIVYENAQARERTQILLSLANRHHALMIGTGDLSEIALGWSTFNGDHMSMYAVNPGVPKTLIQAIVTYVAENTEIKNLAKVLHDIVDTPISPELLPNKKGSKKMAQPTEDILGPYEIHDFFIWNLIGQGFMPPKVLFLAQRAFEGKYEPAFIREKLELFIRRFFASQFKRNCTSDAPMILPIALSQRGDWRMPSDAKANLWLASLENMK